MYPVRVTTDADYFDQNPESTEPWSPGIPLFPVSEEISEGEIVDRDRFLKVIKDA